MFLLLSPILRREALLDALVGGMSGHPAHQGGRAGVFEPPAPAAYIKIQEGPASRPGSRTQRPVPPTAKRTKSSLRQVSWLLATAGFLAFPSRLAGTVALRWADKAALASHSGATAPDSHRLPF